ncbi:MAG TPA: hypothetical protein VIH91_00760 [Terriglobales bacterium]
MDIAKKSRTDLKAYFVKNAIPTESNFADLIDAMLNQKEDGVAKTAGNPLSIEATGDASSLRKSINFYESFADANPAWSISLNPRINPGDATTAKTGFAISDPTGTNRLFIDKSSNHVGIGTVNPQGTLDVQANPRTGTHPTNRIMYVTGDSQEADGIEFRHSNGTQGIGFGYNTIYATGTNASQDLKLAARGTGDVIVTGGLRAGNICAGAPFKIGAGRTAPGSTAWQVYGPTGIYVDVDTRVAGFTQTPVYVVSISGNSMHWATVGRTSVYSATNVGFRIYVRWVDNSALAPATANGNVWHIEWIGVQV